MTRNSFLLLVAAAGAVLVLAVAQVPQPWRAVLVAWLIFCGSVGFVAVRLAHSYHAYRTTSTAHRHRPPARRTREAAPPHANSLRVIASRAAANGRRTI